MMLNYLLARCKSNANDVKRRLCHVVLFAETAAVRFWFGLFSISFASFLLFAEQAEIGPYEMMFKIAPGWLWASGFILNGVALVYGSLMRKYSNLLLMVEGVLGVAVWSAAAAAVSINQGALGGTGIGAILALWILVRYPTHREWEILDRRDA